MQFPAAPAIQLIFDLGESQCGTTKLGERLTRCCRVLGEDHRAEPGTESRHRHQRDPQPTPFIVRTQHLLLESDRDPLLELVSQPADVVITERTTNSSDIASDDVGRRTREGKKAVAREDHMPPAIEDGHATLETSLWVTRRSYRAPPR